MRHVSIKETFHLPLSLGDSMIVAVSPTLRRISRIQNPHPNRNMFLFVTFE
jgi:hypothetical protein